MGDNVLIEYQPIYNNKILYQMFSEFNLLDKIKNANYIVIKPNFAAGTYVELDSHVVTDVKMIGKLIEFLLTIDPNKTIYIAEADSTGFGFAFLKFENLQLPGSLEISEEALKHVRLLDMSRDILKHIENSHFKYFTNFDKQLWLSKTLMECDFIIDATNL